MNNFDRRSLLTEAFTRLRQGGVPLGVGELLDALRAAEGGWGAEGPEGLRELARLLWCHSRQEVGEFDDIWEALLAETPPPAFSGGRTEPPASKPWPPRAPIPNEDGSDPMAPPSGLAAAPSTPQWKPLPMRAPVPALSGGEVSELQTYWPVSRRFMVYAWRYLRRPVPDGPQDVLDIEVTVERAARQGFFLAPVYRRRESNQAHLVLLVDQAGSMVPFHRFTRDLVESACWESTLQQVDAFYFHNVPTASVYHDPHLTERVLLSTWTEILAYFKLPER